MQATAIVPVKRFGAAKQRLCDVLEPTQRAQLAGAMLADVLEALSRSRLIERTLVVSGEPAVAGIIAAAGVECVPDPADRGHSAAAMLGVEVALAAGAGAAALLPGDCPMLDPGELDQALEGLSTGTAVVIPDRHGSGTNGLLLAPPNAIEASFGPDSRERHLRLAGEAGLRPAVAELDSLAPDLDTGGDLSVLRERLASGALRGSSTEIALAALDRPGIEPRPQGAAT